MASSQHPTEPSLAAASAAPRYAPGAHRNSLIAHFTGGARIPVELGRARAYPGLRSEAPSMLAYYDAFAELVPIARVLDAGSGSSNGARRLAQRGFSVVAVELDRNALSFAQKYAPEVEHVHADLAQFQSKAPFHAAIVADVLGHALDPEATLISVVRALRSGASLVVAEAGAHVSQRLTAPQRRSFSLPRLRGLLARTGCSIDAVLSEGIPFVAVMARVTDPGVLEAFSGAYSLAARGLLSQALEALSQAAGSGRLEVEVEVLLAQSEVHLAQGAGDAAARACFRARELAPRDARPLVNLGRIALASGSTSDALHLALEALTLDGTEAAACTLAAVCADSLGHPDALTAWRTAANLAPDDAAIASELARAASRQGDPALGLHGLERVERYGALVEPEFHLTRAWLLLAANRKREAVLEARIAEAHGAERTALDELSNAIAQPG